MIDEKQHQMKGSILNNVLDMFKLVFNFRFSFVFSECVDDDANCPTWASNGDCYGNNQITMHETCPLSCGLCSTGNFELSFRFFLCINFTLAGF